MTDVIENIDKKSKHKGVTDKSHQLRSSEMDQRDLVREGGKV
jgi:hypothetical protein